jgi:hypothetical protein
MKRKESRASNKVAQKREKVMIITRTVSKTVKDAKGADFKRRATITFEVPESNEDLASLISAFGSVAKLSAAAFYGVISKARLDATNELMRSDKASKALKKMVSALKAVMPSLTDEGAVRMMMNNPAVAKAFESGPVSAEITLDVNPASADFTFPNLVSEDTEETEEDTVA